MSRYDALEEAVVSKSSLLDRLTIKLRLVLLIIAVGVVFCIGTSVVFFQQFSDKLYEEKENQTSYMTEAALNVIQMYADKVKKGELPLKEAQEMAKASVANMKYDNGNYIWINSFDGIMLVHPNKSLIGQNVANIKDKKSGKPFFAEISTQVQQKGTGTSTYYWTKPGQPDSQSFPKVSFGYGSSEWKWVIATGTYIDDVEEEIQHTLVSILGLSVLMLGAIIFTAYFTIARSIINPIEKLSSLSLRLAENDLRIVIPEDNNKTEIGNLNRAFRKFVENLRELVEDITKSSEEISAGTEEINAASEQSAQGAQQVAKSSTQLAEGSQQIAQSISQLAAGSQRVSGKISELAGGTKQISKNVVQLTEGIQLISQNVEDGANSLNKMNLSIQDISTEAGDIAKLGNETEENANTGKEFIKKAVDKINSIREVSGEISDTISELGKLSCEIETIVDLIKNIAGQTNLLALNAAIEAARAGEHGKGFAVVAEEVKKLAGQSEQATGRITEMIKEIQYKTRVAVDSMGKGVSEVDDGVYVINDVGNALGSVIEQVRQTNSKIQGISQEIGGVAKNSDTIVKMIENISSITEQAVSNAQEISSVTEQTSSNAEEIASITEETAASAEEISSVTQETAASAEEISSISEEQTASSEEISASIQSLVKIVETLHTKVSKFKI